MVTGKKRSPVKERPPKIIKKRVPKIYNECQSGAVQKDETDARPRPLTSVFPQHVNVSLVATARQQRTVFRLDDLLGVATFHHCVFVLQLVRQRETRGEKREKREKRGKRRERTERPERPERTK